MQIVPDFHVVLEGVVALVGLAAPPIGMLIKNQLSEIKIVLEKNKGEILTAQTKLEGLINQHVSNDEIRHTDFDRRLDNLERQ